jgi:hypothetical protein
LLPSEAEDSIYVVGPIHQTGRMHSNPVNERVLYVD